MYEVFIHDRPLVLTSSYPNLRDEAAVLFLKYDGETSLDDAAEAVRNNVCGCRVVLHHSNVEELWAAFKSRYRWIEAAGGVVLNSHHQKLMIHRNGLWDLPKGKVEQGEAVEEAALREVEEECGIAGLTLGEKLPNTYHTYPHKGKTVLKCTHWYRMTGDAETLTPQAEEGIDKVAWMARPEAEKAAFESYRSLQKLIAEVW